MTVIIKSDRIKPVPHPFQPQDHYFKKAQETGFRARSVFKLQEIQKKYKLIKEGNIVLDLGAAPGSWLQLTSHVVGQKGLIVGVDLEPIEPFREKNIITLRGDIFDEEFLAKELSEMNIKEFDVVLSDLAPSTSGIKDLDQGKSADLARQALKIALKYLKKGGNLLVKVLEGEELEDFLSEMRNYFSRVKPFKPGASRGRSREIYLISFKKLG